MERVSRQRKHLGKTTKTGKHGTDLKIIFHLIKQEPAENLDCPELIAEFMAEQKSKQNSSNSNNNKRTHSTSKSSENHLDQDNESPSKRPRVEYEQTGYNRGLVPEKLMGATDIYDGELMFL